MPINRYIALGCESVIDPDQQLQNTISLKHSIRHIQAMIFLIEIKI